jgi:hypothetical protein
VKALQMNVRNSDINIIDLSWDVISIICSNLQHNQPLVRTCKLMRRYCLRNKPYRTLVQFFITYPISDTYYCFETAIKVHNILAMQCIYNYIECINLQVRTNGYNMVVQNNHDLINNGYNIAIVQNNHEVIQWFTDRRCPDIPCRANLKALVEACRYTSLDLLKLILQNTTLVDDKICRHIWFGSMKSMDEEKIIYIHTLLKNTYAGQFAYGYSYMYLKILKLFCVNDKTKLVMFLFDQYIRDYRYSRKICSIFKIACCNANFVLASYLYDKITAMGHSPTINSSCLPLIRQKNTELADWIMQKDHYKYVDIPEM